MDMSVTVGAAGDERQPRNAAAKKSPAAPTRAISMLGWRRSRRWASSSASPPRSIPISKPRPSPIWSAARRSPALLFENIKGHPGHKALYNMIGCNLSRFCLMIGEQPVDHPLKAVQILQQKLGRKMPPKEVSADQAICNQNIVEGDDIDIRMFPAQRMWPLDGGMYLGTGDAVVTKDPETGRDQRRHLPHDDQRPARGRRLHLARQGRHHRPREVVEDGQADADRRRLWHRSAAVPGRRDEPAEDRERVRILFRHQRRADRGVHQRPHRPAAAGARRDHARRLSLSGRDLRRRAVRRVHRLLRPAERRHALYAGRARALSRQSDLDLRADGGRRRRTRPGCSGRRCAPPASGPTCRSSACRASRACGRSRRPPAGASPWSRSSRCMPATRRR